MRCKKFGTKREAESAVLSGNYDAGVILQMKDSEDESKETQIVIRQEMCDAVTNYIVRNSKSRYHFNGYMNGDQAMICFSVNMRPEKVVTGLESC